MSEYDRYLITSGNGRLQGMQTRTPRNNYKPVYNPNVFIPMYNDQEYLKEEKRTPQNNYKPVYNPNVFIPMYNDQEYVKEEKKEDDRVTELTYQLELAKKKINAYEKKMKEIISTYKKREAIAQKTIDELNRELMELKLGDHNHEEEENIETKINLEKIRELKKKLN